jgi:hypothetical protein
MLYNGGGGRAERQMRASLSLVTLLDEILTNILQGHFTFLRIAAFYLPSMDMLSFN